MSGVERIEHETLFVDRHVDERFAVVTLHRPDHLNAGSPDLFRELGEVMRGFDGDDAVRAVVLTGGEGKSFSAGADLGNMTFDNMGNCSWFIRRCHEAFESIERLPKVVVAAVNGYAFGFGLEITLACDLVLASDRARFGLREMNHGLVPAVTVTRGLDIIGRRRVAWMTYTSDDLSAQEAREFGFVNKVVPHERLVEEYEALASRLAKRAPLAIAVSKRLLTKDAGAHYREGENTMPAIFASKDVEEGRAAFADRREPKFVGE
ncbi:MAG TPA: enoyl-CoA hydratase/isomerase family protein [Acidimicrobiales bacterium]|nr:enoyl-CoA hydratase/isomerase family protein [Acidimicrobiales bacterium]